MSLPLLHFSSLESNEVYGDIVETYRLAAASLGYPTARQDGYIDSSAINLLFFYWPRPWNELAQHRERCIFVNFEPLSEESHAFNAQYLHLLRHAYRWDYSRTDFHRAIDLGLGPGDYVPLGYQASVAKEVALSERLSEEERDIDVLFFGLVTPRRQHVFEQLRARGLRVRVSDGPTYWSNAERDAYIRRAKVVINFHRMENHRMVEIHRLSILFRHRKAIVTELYPDSEIDPSLRNVVVGAPYEDLVPAIISLVNDPVRRAALEAEGLPAFARLGHAQRMAPALERFLSWRKRQAVALAPPATTPRAQPLETLDLCIAPHSDAPSAHELDARTDNYNLLTPPLGTIGTAAAWNQCIERSTSAYMAFSVATHVAGNQDFDPQRQTLDSDPSVDVVVTCDEASDRGAFIQIADELVARLLSAHPPQLTGALVRRTFLERTGIRFDEEMEGAAGLNFLCKCAARGARFAGVPCARGEGASLLHGDAAPPIAPSPAALRARDPLIAAMFPDLTQREIRLFAELRSTHWPADLLFAEHVLNILSRILAVDQPRSAIANNEYVVREVRRDAAHLLHVFFSAGLLTPEWMDRLFSNVAVAEFLGPIGRGLPIRPRKKS